MIKKLLILLLLCSTAQAQFWNQKPMLGREINWLHRNAQDLIGCWLMNEGGGNIVNDLSGNGNGGTILSDTTWSSGPYGSNLLFDGSGGGVNCGNNSSLNITGDMTIVFSFTPDALGTQRIIHKNTSYSLFTIAGSQIRLHNYGDGSKAESNTVFTIDTLQHAAVVKKGAVVDFYRDGIDIGATDSSITASIPVSVVNLYIGIDEDLSGFPYDGHIDYIYLYNRALSAREIQSLYINPFAMFEPVFPVWWYGGIGAPPAGGGQVIFIN